jgi:hypothetical protein
MSPGNNNGKNYGGMHTGCGKKNKTGIYNTTIHQKRQPNNMFKIGTKVYNIKSGLKGEIIEKQKYKSMRSLSKVKYTNSTTQYILNKLLRTTDYFKTTQKKMLSKVTNQKNNNKNKNKNHTYREKRKEFREYRKLTNDKLLEKYDNKCKNIDKHNDSVNYKLKTIKDKLNNLDKTKSNYKNIQSKLLFEYNNVKQTYKLKPSYLSQDGSSPNLAQNVHDYSSYVDYVYKDNNIKLNVEDDYEIIKTYPKQTTYKKDDSKEIPYKIRRLLWGLY